MKQQFMQSQHIYVIFVGNLSTDTTLCKFSSVNYANFLKICDIKKFKWICKSCHKSMLNKSMPRLFQERRAIAHSHIHSQTFRSVINSMHKSSFLLHVFTT